SLAMSAVGRFLASDPSRRALAFALLSRASERLRAEARPDAATELALGETAAALAPGDGAAAAAFQRAIDALSGAPGPRGLRARAAAGLLRGRHPVTATGLVALLDETPAWLAIAAGADDDAVAALAVERGGSAAGALGRLLLAVSRLGELEALASHVEETASHLPSPYAGRLTPRSAPAGGRCATAGSGTSSPRSSAIRGTARASVWR